MTDLLKAIPEGSGTAYDNIIMHKREEDQAFGARLLSLVGLGSGSESQTDDEADLIAVKCDLCFGKPDYACVQACPSKAMAFGDEDDPQSAMTRRRIDNKLRRYLVLEEINTGPNVTYLRDIY